MKCITFDQKDKIALDLTDVEMKLIRDFRAMGREDAGMMSRLFGVIAARSVKPRGHLKLMAGGAA